MARYRNEDDDRDYYPREERFRREALGAYDEPMTRRREFEIDRERRTDFGGRGRFGERADYNYDEPRYGNYRENRERWDEGNRDWDRSGRSTLDEIRGDLSTRRRYGSIRFRSFSPALPRDHDQGPGGRTERHADHASGPDDETGRHGRDSGGRVRRDEW